MFDELLSVKKSFGRDDIQLYGNEAAKSSLENGDSLNEKIASIATREDLNNDQIQRIVEEANTIVDLHNKGETFELAKQASVIAIIRKKPVASEVSDYDSQPCPHSQADSSGFNELFGVKDQVSPVITPQATAHIKIIKLGAARDELSGHSEVLQMHHETLLKDLVKTAEAQYHEDEDVLSSVFGIAKLAAPVEAGRMGRLVDRYMQSKGLIEKTASVVSEDLISEDLKNKALIQNGSHKILRKIETIKKVEDDIAKVKLGVIDLDEEIGKTKDELKAL